MEVFISTMKEFGFPVACVVVLFILLQREQESHKAESSQLTNAINDLKIVLAKISAKIGGVDDER